MNSISVPDAQKIAERRRDELQAAKQHANATFWHQVARPDQARAKRGFLTLLAILEDAKRENRSDLLVAVGTFARQELTWIPPRNRIAGRFELWVAEQAETQLARLAADALCRGLEPAT